MNFRINNLRIEQFYMLMNFGSILLHDQFVIYDGNNIKTKFWNYYDLYWSKLIWLIFFLNLTQSDSSRSV
jgi:hypothetical protein